MLSEAKYLLILRSALGPLAATVYGAGLALPGKQHILDFLKSAHGRTAAVQRSGIEEVISVLENDS